MKTIRLGIRNYAFPFVLALSLCFVSCSKDDPVEPSTIIKNETLNSGGGSSGGSGGESGGESSTNGYTITSTSVCSIVVAKGSSTGTKYSNSWYKWVTSTGRVILSRSKTNSNSWVGVASKNNDSSCKGIPVGSYTYKFVDYSTVAVVWYHYFN